MTGPPPTPAPEPNGSRLTRTGRALTLAVTNAIKLGGLWIAIHEIASQAQPRLVEMAIALFMMTGAQVSEAAVLRLATALFGVHPADPHEPK